MSMQSDERSPQGLGSLDIERLRFSGERDAAALLRSDVWLRDMITAAESRGRPDPARVKPDLIARSLRRTEGMAQATWEAARTAARVLGVGEPLEIDQSSGVENAAVYRVASPVLLEIRGRLMTLLDRGAAIAVFGHERDVNVFSLGHAPVLRRSGPLAGQLYVPARFGPLGLVGGERRLTVAVSRAKRECVVVSSFEPSMLSVAGARNEGPKLLRAFLELCAQGGSSSVQPSK